jgi:hypothetical protein
MIERMAEAAHEACRSQDRPGTSDSDINPLLPKPWGKLRPYERKLAAFAMRAALLKIRSPSRDAAIAAIGELIDCEALTQSFKDKSKPVRRGAVFFGPEDAALCWSKMIDAILAEIA